MASKAKEQIPAGNGVVTVVGEEGREAQNAVVEMVTKSLAQAKDNRSRVMVGTNLDLTTFAGKALMLKAASPQDYDVEPGGTLKMVVVAYAFFPDEVENRETHEIEECTRVVFFDPQGKTFRTTATHAPTRLQIACGLFTPAQWQAGIPFEIRSRKGKKGFYYHDIQVDTSALVSF